MSWSLYISDWLHYLGYLSLFAVSWETCILKLGYQIHEKTKHSMQRKQALLRDIHMRKQIIFILCGNETMSFYCLEFNSHRYGHQSLNILTFKSNCTTQVRLTMSISLAYSKTYGKCLCSLKTAINIVYVTIPHASNSHKACCESAPWFEQWQNNISFQIQFTCKQLNALKSSSIVLTCHQRAWRISSWNADLCYAVSWSAFAFCPSISAAHLSSSSAAAELCLADSSYSFGLMIK